MITDSSGNAFKMFAIYGNRSTSRFCSCNIGVSCLSAVANFDVIILLNYILFTIAATKSFLLEKKIGDTTYA